MLACMQIVMLLYFLVLLRMNSSGAVILQWLSFWFLSNNWGIVLSFNYNLLLSNRSQVVIQYLTVVEFWSRRTWMDQIESFEWNPITFEVAEGLVCWELEWCLVAGSSNDAGSMLEWFYSFFYPYFLFLLVISQAKDNHNFSLNGKLHRTT